MRMAEKSVKTVAISTVGIPSLLQMMAVLCITITTGLVMSVRAALHRLSIGHWWQVGIVFRPACTLAVAAQAAVEAAVAVVAAMTVLLVAVVVALAEAPSC